MILSNFNCAIKEIEFKGLSYVEKRISFFKESVEYGESLLLLPSSAENNHEYIKDTIEYDLKQIIIYYNAMDEFMASKQYKNNPTDYA